MDTLIQVWGIGMTLVVAATAVLLARCYLASRAVEKRIEREIDAIWGD